jgi:uncharacterized protein YbjT (DUF2867 family)
MTSQDPILVLGGTGHYGRHIVRSLLEKGEPVRVVSRNAHRARQILGERVEIIEGDLLNRKSTAEAMQNARAIVISVSALAPRLARKLFLIERDAVLDVIAAAQETGPSRFVYVSVYDFCEDLISRFDLSIARLKQTVEGALRHSSLAWTILGAAPSMDIFFAMIRGDTMVVPGGGPPTLPTVASSDVGEIVAQTVLRDDLAGQRIRMVGPEALSFPEAARRLSVATGQPIHYRKLPLMPLRIAAALTEPFNPYLRHIFDSVLLMNHFPQDIAAQVPTDHQRLSDTFDYRPTTLEMEARRWLKETHHAHTKNRG